MLQGDPSYIITPDSASFAVTMVTPSDDTLILPADASAITEK
jgi:hypothetical protein